MIIIELLILLVIALLWTIFSFKNVINEAQKSPKATKKEGSIVFLKGKVKHYK